MVDTIFFHVKNLAKSEKSWQNKKKKNIKIKINLILLNKIPSNFTVKMCSWTTVTWALLANFVIFSAAQEFNENFEGQENEEIFENNGKLDQNQEFDTAAHHSYR